MALFGKTKVPLIELPEGTLLFRVVPDKSTDFTGVKVEDGSYCIPPQYNVFFYFDPFTAEIFPEYLGMIATVEVYKGVEFVIGPVTSNPLVVEKS